MGVWSSFECLMVMFIMNSRVDLNLVRWQLLLSLPQVQEHEWFDIKFGLESQRKIGCCVRLARQIDNVCSQGLALATTCLPASSASVVIPFLQQCAKKLE